MNEGLNVVLAEARSAGVGDVADPDPVELLRDLYPALLRSARQIVGSDQAEDLVQEALVRTLVSHPRFRGLDRPIAYARATLFRLAFRRWRIRKFEVPLDPDFDVADQGEALGARLEFLGHLEGLGRKQRACLVLRFAYHLGDEQIARMLGCSTVTVRTQTSRALAALRERRGDTDADA